MACRFSARIGLLPERDTEQVVRLLRRLNLPVAPPPADPGQFLGAMAMDKKVVAGEIRLVLLDRIGSARITRDYPAHELAAYLAAELMA
jgi:3-dehydroquinate synthase